MTGLKDSSPALLRLSMGSSATAVPVTQRITGAAARCLTRAAGREIAEDPPSAGRTTSQMVGMKAAAPDSMSRTAKPMASGCLSCSRGRSLTANP